MVPTGNASTISGGGLYCESRYAVVTNCALTGNQASDGGGVYDGTLNNCFLIGNYATSSGGGALSATLINCTLRGNRARNGGGAAAFSPDYSLLSNCIVISNSATYGGGVNRSTLTNCTLIGNSDGGATESVLSNCALTGNSTQADGGAAYYCTLNNCTLSGNSARLAGGGAYGSTLINCTVVGNSARNGGGVSGETLLYTGNVLKNSIIYYNTAPFGANVAAIDLNYCCTTPLPSGGIGNISSLPLLVDYGGGNLRLQSNSPCINAGNNAFVSGPTDLDGNARIVDGTVDIGAYEFRVTASSAPAAPVATAASLVTTNSFMASWSAVNGATGYRLDIAADFLFNNYISGYQKLDVGNVTNTNVIGLGAGTTYYYRVRAYNTLGTSTNSNTMQVKVLMVFATNAAKLKLQMSGGQAGLTIEGVPGGSYRIEYSTNLSQTNWTKLLDLTLLSSPFSFLDSGAVNSTSRFYRALVP